ncbi:uncharacterized protein TM35_000301210 [Trypanosoma theileri]|uniref:Uncharacterized protein n=1 Tax=Trypanosoma theileri TaxID=67003 RepID=A0A1X0NNA2_9TRYP|nr:uncharacterized protein TM35_000301210 [Trypanosoma theileri]ORC86081.1 hypothetical protein TM35_000301210 [Trypanosoma theileri]
MISFSPTSYSFASLLRTPARVSLLLLLPLLLVLLITFTSAGVHAGSIVGPTSWKTTNGAAMVGNSISIPLFAGNGSMLQYVEVLSDAQLLRYRSARGTTMKEYNVPSLSGCTEPTGVAFFNQGPRAFIFCGSGTTFYDIQIDLATSDPRVDPVQTGETFIPSSVSHPHPVVVVRGSSTDTREDAVLALGRQGDLYCVGLYTSSESAVCCQRDAISDFYLSTWEATTDTQPTPKAYIVTETKLGAGLRLDSYYLPTFASGVTPNATVTLSFTGGANITHTNVNDANSSAPLIAYVQAVFETTVKVTVEVVNAYTLESVKGGTVDTGIRGSQLTSVSSAYMVTVGNTNMLVVQTSDLLMVIDYMGFPEATTPLWIAQISTVPGLLFSPLRDLNALAGEWYRRLRSPSYSDYNPYHLIQASAVRVISTEGNISTYTLSNGSNSTYNALWNNAGFCSGADQMSAITAFDESLAYVGCKDAGHYTLVDLSNDHPYYPVTWPSVSLSNTQPFGFISGTGSISLMKGTNALGVDLNPLLLYSSSTLQVYRTSPSGDYYRGRFALLTEDVSSSQNMLFNFYQHTVSGTEGGRDPMAPTAGPTSLPRNVTSAQPFTVFFGDRKRYIAAVTTPGVLSVFSAMDGSKVSDLNISDCVGAGEGNQGVVTFMTSLQHFGTFTDYHVVLGGTSSCLFEVNDTLEPRISRTQQVERGVVVGTTRYSGYKYTTSSKTLQAFTSFFDGGTRSVYQVANIGSYVVGSNVFVYILSGNITCRSVRSDIIVWTQVLPQSFTAPVIHMAYYNNTVFVVDQRNIFRFDVQYREDDDGSSRVLFQKAVEGDGVILLTAGVGQGMVAVYASTNLYAYDAVTGTLLWKTTPRTTQLPENAQTEIVIYSPEDAGSSNTAETGPAYVEVRIKTPAPKLTQMSDVYTQNNGTALTSISDTPNQLNGPIIWGNNYLTFSPEGTGGMVSFRALNLPNVEIPNQAKRPAASTTDVYVPGESPINPLPPRLPRGDTIMASAPPMTFSLKGDSALISADRSRAIVGTIEERENQFVYTARCIKVSDPQGTPIREWTISTGSVRNTANFLEFDSNNFFIFTPSRLTIYSWSTCQAVGNPISLSGLGDSLPSYISRPSQNQWIYLNAQRVTALQPSTGAQAWQASVGSCNTIRPSGNYIICDGGSGVAVIDATGGVLTFQDAPNAAFASAGSNFAGVVASSEGYKAVYYSSSAKLFETTIMISSGAGKPVGAISGKSTENIIVTFENLAISLTFNPASKTALVEWSNDLNGETAKPSALGYTAAGNANIVIGTTNGIIMLDAAKGNGFTNISLPIRYDEVKNEVQNFKMLTVTSNTLYAFMWNGYVSLVTCTPSSASAHFAFGFGLKRGMQLSFADGFLLAGAGYSAGIIPVDMNYWGAPVASAAVGLKSNGTLFMAGWDLTNITNVNLVSVSPTGRTEPFGLSRETEILSSLVTGTRAAFFGSRTISSISGETGSGMEYSLPAACVGTSLKSISRTDSVSGFSVVWYSGSTRDCIFVLGQQGSPPSLLATLTSSYKGVENVRYGKSFAVLTTNQLSSVGYDGSPILSRTLNAPSYISSLSSRDTGDGIFIVISNGNRVDCFQVAFLLPVWNYTLSAPSRAPVTYYNNSVFISTERGPSILDLAEYTYPCPDRLKLFVQREVVTGRTTYHSQVVIDEQYGIGFVTTYQTFYAFDTFTGKILWQRPDLYSVKSAAVLRDGMLLVASSETGNVIFLNPFTGASLLYFPNAAEESTEIFVYSNGEIIGFGGTMSTVINITTYARYFSSVSANRPKLPQLPSYRPYNYAASDHPNDCSPPNSSNTPIIFSTSEEWVSGSLYGLRGASQALVSIPSGRENGWAAALIGRLVYLSRAYHGTFYQSTFFPLNATGCNVLSLYAVSAEKVIVGVGCGKTTNFYNASGGLQGTVSRIGKSSTNIVLRGNGYYINSDNNFDAVSLSTFAVVPPIAASTKCTETYDMIPLPKKERIIFYCSNVGIRSMHYSQLVPIGATVKGPAGQTTFSSYEVNEALSVGIACGSTGSSSYMVAFNLDGMTNIVNHTEPISGKTICGIRYPHDPSTANPIFVFTYRNGYKTWPIKGGDPTSQSIQDFVPAAISSLGIIYRNAGFDYFFRRFGNTTSSLIFSADSDSTGYMILQGPDDVPTSSSVVVYGNSFSFAVNTSFTNPTPLWTGKGNIDYKAGAPYATSGSFVYTSTKSNHFIGLMVSNVSFALQGVSQTRTAIIDKQQRVFVSQPGTIGCLDSNGNVLWNNRFSNAGGVQAVFKPVVLDSSDFILVSGGSRAAAIVNKRTGVLARSFQLERCAVAPDSTEGTVVVNGTMVYVTLRGWSCVHVIDLDVKNNSGVITVPDVLSLEIEGATGGVTAGFPLRPKVGSANYLLFAAITPNTENRNLTFSLYGIESLKPFSWKRLRTYSLRAVVGSISTYGYFLYTGVQSTLNVYDLLTGRYVWGYIFETDIVGPVLGVDRTLYVATLKGIQSLRSNLNTPWALRRMGNVSFIIPMTSVPRNRMGPIRTSYGQVIFSSNIGTFSFKHLREGTSLTPGWVSEKSVLYHEEAFLTADSPIGLFDSDNGTGVLDLTSGLMFWLSGVYASRPLTNGVSLANAPFFVCSFVAEDATCRQVPQSLLRPQNPMPLYEYLGEPEDKTPDDWTPIYPDGGGSKPVRPSAQCLSLMHAHIPSFANCVNIAIASIYPNGRESKLTCPADFLFIKNCQENLNALADFCVDVITYMMDNWKQQTMDAASPVGVCVREEAAHRCQTEDNETLQNSCSFVTMSFVTNGYENPIGYDIAYPLPAFNFPSAVKPSNVGAVVGGVIAAVVVVLIGVGVGVYFYRKRSRKRDARFFDDDAELTSHLTQKEEASEVFKPASRRSPALSSKESSLLIGGLAARPPAPPLTETTETTPLISTITPPVNTAAEGPRKMPAKMPVKMMAKKAVGPKLPTPPAPSKTVNTDIIDGDDL